MPDRSPDERFGADFYRRYYRDPLTRVVTSQEMARRADFVAAFMRHMDLEVRSILDLGCGLGLMRRQLLRRFPGARYTGVEVSPYLCKRYGWVQGSAASYRPAQPFDLVICHDVLQYLDDSEAEAAMRNFGRICSHAMHFSALTREDWERHCDRRRTDRNVHLRPGDWYRGRLARRFVNTGSGMFVRRGTIAQLWDLDRI
jgi:SAM-dependent methyltransferase